MIKEVVEKLVAMEIRVLLVILVPQETTEAGAHREPRASLDLLVHPELLGQLVILA